MKTKFGRVGFSKLVALELDRRNTRKCGAFHGLGREVAVMTSAGRSGSRHASFDSAINAPF